MFGAGWRMSLARGTGTIRRGAFISSPSVPLRNISHTESCSSAPLCSFLLRSLDVNFKVTGGGQARAEFRGGHPLLAHPFEDGCQGEIWAIVRRLGIQIDGGRAGLTLTLPLPLTRTLTLSLPVHP